jgi:hypothetical protein
MMFATSLCIYHVRSLTLEFVVVGRKANLISSSIILRFGRMLSIRCSLNSSLSILLVARDGLQRQLRLYAFKAMFLPLFSLEAALMQAVRSFSPSAIYIDNGYAPPSICQPFPEQSHSK